MYTCRRRHRHIPAFYIVVGLCLSIVKFLGHPQTTIFFPKKVGGGGVGGTKCQGRYATHNRRLQFLLVAYTNK